MKAGIGPIRVGAVPTPRHHSSASVLRLGLCCQFAEYPCKFRTTTASSLMRLKPADRQQKISEICLSNAQSLLQALQFCAEHGIGCFRILSTILPLKTHPEAGYSVVDLPQGELIIESFRRCGIFAVANGIRTVFHPDQFVVLNSPRKDVVDNAIADLEYHAELCEWLNADVINIHAGGAYGDKVAAINSLARNIDLLPDAIRSRLTFENDDKTYTPTDLLPLCRSAGVPLVYDVHHHRCLPDGLSVEEATERALATWNREPLFHLSSPLAGWGGPRPERHHDFILVSDFPDCWQPLSVTVEVEAKAKELAVLRLRDELSAIASKY